MYSLWLDPSLLSFPTAFCPQMTQAPLTLTPPMSRDSLPISHCLVQVVLPAFKHFLLFLLEDSLTAPLFP